MHIHIDMLTFMIFVLLASHFIIPGKQVGVFWMFFPLTLDIVVFSE